MTELANGFRGSSSSWFPAVKHSTEETDYLYNSSIDSDSATRNNTEETWHKGGSEESTTSLHPSPEYPTDLNEHIDESEESSNNDHSEITEPSLVTIFTEDSEELPADNWSTRNSMETAEATNGTGLPESREQPTTPSPTGENDLTGSYKSSRDIDYSSITTRNTTESIEYTDGSEPPDSADGPSEDMGNTMESVNYTESFKATISGDYPTTAKTSHLTDSTGELGSISYSSSESITKASDGSGGPSTTLDSAEYSTGAASHAYSSSDLNDGSDGATMHSTEATEWVNGSIMPTTGTFPPGGGSEPQTEYNNEATKQSNMSEGPGSGVPSISTSLADESTHQYSTGESYTTTASDEAGSRRARTEKYNTDTSYSAAVDETESSRNSSTQKHSTEFATATDDLAWRYSTTAKEHEYISHGGTTSSGSRTRNSAGTTDESSSDGPTYAGRSRSTQYTPNYTVTESRTGSTEYGSRSERPENADDTATKHTTEVTKQSHVSEGLINDSHSTTSPTAGTMSHSFSPTSPQGHPTKRPTDEDSSGGNTVIEKTISTVKNRTAFITFVGGAYLTTDSSIILSTSEKSKSTKRLDNQNSKANATAATHHKDDPGETDAHHPTKHGTHSSKSSVGSYDGYFTKKKKPTETTAKRPQDSHESFSTKRSTHSDDSTERSEENHPTKKATVVTTKRQDSSKSDRDDDSGESDKDGDSHESSSKDAAVTPGGDTQTSMPSVTQCPQIKFDLSNSLSPLPSSKELSGPQPVGTMVIHMCAVSYVFPTLQQPLKIYKCLNTGKWTDNNNGDKCEYVAPRKKNSADL
ncbi:hypothetical protein GCK32_003788 [Trichostrongylus colubriformis]|uniref:Sushi domain-containing protein n=1 Tax=Trichostrongylus colubriformis TaxID=6319 RepID=A0AAN8FY96_TRICO